MAANHTIGKINIELTPARSSANFCLCGAFTVISKTDFQLALCIN